ncbi:MAG TPA: response regulator [Xanthobacteraceae bacterium]|nr:response regulator [Xanthobacteraceae bacterium]
MAEARARIRTDGFGLRASLSRLTRGLLAAPFFAGLAMAIVQLGNAGAQDNTLPPSESGDIGFAGMLAGLLVVALATLALRHRRTNAMAERLTRLETFVENRDDRIWALEEAIARATKLADAQGDLVLREDEAGRVTHASDMLCALVQKRRDEIVGRALVLHVRAESPRIPQPDGSITFDQQIETENGPRWIAWKEVTVRDEAGRIVEIQRVGRDMTVRAAAEKALADASEKAEAASRAKSRFLAVVSHEVRTPLNGILGMADLLLETKLSPEQQTYARAMKTSGEALLTLIAEILDFSKIEAGRLDLEAIPFDLAALVTDVVELLAPRAQAKGIEIAADIDDHIPSRVAGDAARLRQVLLNLGGNAVKFTDEGGVSVLVEAGESGRVRFVVKDTGPGIEPEVQARIFNEFEQGDSTLARRHDGTGLGLAIASRIVERMGGEIGLTSGPEHGSSFAFSVELPAIADDRAPAASPDFSFREILIASPSPVIGPLLERRLTAWGAHATLASEAKIAAALLPERRWDHLLVDRAFGAEATHSLVRTAARHAKQRILLLAPSERSELSGFKRAGFDGYLVKPVRAASLAARLHAPESETDAESAFDAESEARPGRKQKALAILVAEDNEINALLAQAMLGKLGHIPTVVTDGVAAVAAVTTAQAIGAPYDLVLMDLHLPGMDGLEATRRIRALGEGGGNVPIIALTSNAFAEDREACRAAGMNGFIVKPFDRERLDEAIAALRGKPKGGKKTQAA